MVAILEIMNWQDKAYETWLARLSIAADAGGVSLSESDCEVLIAILLNERKHRAQALVVHS
jgi:hypothetical protein